MTTQTIAGPRLLVWRGPEFHWRQREGRGLTLALVVFIALFSIVPMGRLIAAAFDGGLVGSDSGVFSTIISILTAFGSVITTAFYAAMHIAFALHFYNIDERKEGGNLRSKIEGLSD